jgi:hypothetical protein
MFITARFLPGYFANGITTPVQADVPGDADAPGHGDAAGHADAADQVEGSVSV